MEQKGKMMRKRRQFYDEPCLGRQCCRLLDGEDVAKGTRSGDKLATPSVASLSSRVSMSILE